MGITDQFTTINQELRSELGYHLDPENSDKFRSLLRLAGIRRARHCVKLVKLEGLQGSGAHQRLVDLIWAHMPPKTSKYRNPQVQAMNLAQRREFEYAMAKDGE